MEKEKIEMRVRDREERGIGRERDGVAARDRNKGHKLMQRRLAALL